MMPDLEKVIKGLECCASMNGSACRECPYSSECVAGEATYQTGTAHLAADALELLKAQEPKWISVKDRLPKEHDSMFAQFYGTSKWNGAMWRTESDRVLVAILFPDGTRTVDKGKLQDGEWRTGVARVLPQKVTHWALWPEPPKEES